MKQKCLRPLHIVAILFSITGILAGLGSYFTIVNGKTYQVAESYLVNNQVVKQRIGLVKSTRLGFFGSMMSHRGPKGIAKFRIKLDGEIGEAEAIVNLAEEDGNWLVKQADLKLDEEVIPLVR